MPVDTGFLRASLLAQLNSVPSGVRVNPSDVRSYTYNAGATSAVILAARLGDTIYAVYTANYARFVEYGANGHPGYGFVRLAVQKWDSIVEEVASELRNRK